MQHVNILTQFLSRSYLPFRILYYSIPIQCISPTCYSYSFFYSPQEIYKNSLFVLQESQYQEVFCNSTVFTSLHSYDILSVAVGKIKAWKEGWKTAESKKGCLSSHRSLFSSSVILSWIVDCNPFGAGFYMLVLK